MGKKMFYIRLAIYITVFAIALICITGFKAEEKILVIVPHPDDDVLSCAGVIRATVNNGKDVRIMYVTNGDYGNIAELRCMEIIKAMKVLGVKKDEIYYLGYGDSEVLQNAYNAKNNPKQVFSSKPGYTQTYGWEHLKLDYHYEKYDAHASYCRQDILSDIQGIIGDFMPDDIYMPSPMEEHPDHSKSSEFVTEAVLNIKASEDINTLERYEPVIHEYMMYKAYLPPYDVDIDAEPVPISDKDADIDNTTIYRWNDRESVPVPDEMMAPISSGKNLKAEALNMYYSQGPKSHYRFVRSDEIFWKRKMSSISYNAVVTASTEKPGDYQGCANVKDGVALGAPYDPTKEWATIGEKNGAWIQLSWPSVVKANRIVLYDRPGVGNNILRATLAFSNGYSIPVSSLPNSGSPHAINFQTREFTWVKLIIDEAEGYDTGLSEFEVYHF